MIKIILSKPFIYSYNLVISTERLEKQMQPIQGNNKNFFIFHIR